MKSYRPRLNIDALVLGCYDLLIDTRYSYREVVRQAVQLYLEQALGLTPSKTPLITPEEVLLLQKRGCFCSYWDLSYALAMYFVEMLPPVPAPTFPSRMHVPALIAYLQLSAGRMRFTIDTLRGQKNIDQFAADVAAAGGGIDGAHQVLPKENRHLLIASGKVTKTNIVARIFQELYLGADLFERVYQEPAIIVQSTGYAEHDSLIVDPDVLQKLSDKLPLGLVSDRPRREVERSLKTHQIDGYFQAIVAWEDIEDAHAKPIPDGWPLLEAARRLQPTPTHSAYVGANVGDMWAAREANRTVPFTAIACLVGAPDKSELRDAFETHKANMILGHPNNLKELILG